MIDGGRDVAECKGKFDHSYDLGKVGVFQCWYALGEVDDVRRVQLVTIQNQKGNQVINRVCGMVWHGRSSFGCLGGKILFRLGFVRWSLPRPWHRLRIGDTSHGGCETGPHGWGWGGSRDGR